jgi:hypothetical protein
MWNDHFRSMLSYWGRSVFGLFEFIVVSSLKKMKKTSRHCSQSPSLVSRRGPPKCEGGRGLPARRAVTAQTFRIVQRWPAYFKKSQSNSTGTEVLFAYIRGVQVRGS